jgi:hypothetical protein
MGSEGEMIFSSSGANCSIRFDDWDDTRSPDIAMPPVATAIINASGATDRSERSWLTLPGTEAAGEEHEMSRNAVWS